jgi:predicted RNase H-like nuclease (RuvC/YqgF family)
MPDIEEVKHTPNTTTETEAPTRNLSPTEKKIQALETEYNKLTTDLQEATDHVHDLESKLIKTTRELLPAQNAYLVAIINRLTKQAQEKSS